MPKANNNKAIVSINKTTSKVFELRGNEISSFDLEKSSKSKKFYISYIPYKDIITTTIEIARAISEDDVPDTIAIKIYEELALDTALDYKITYLESSAGSGDSRFFNVFVVNSAIVNNDFEYIAEQTNGYIDYIALAPFLPEALYKRNLLNSDGVDCFVYLQKDDAFLVIYNSGEYFQSRQLRYSLKHIFDKFCELIGNRKDEKEFFDKLLSHGINFENTLERDSIIQIFDDMFFYIGDIITSIKKIYGLNIKDIYFGSDIGNIPGVEAFIEQRLGLEYKELKFSIALNEREVSLSPLDTMMLLTAQNYLSNQNNEYNYSPFQRPPPLAQRSSGKFLGTIAAALLITFAYPAYQFLHGIYYEKLTEAKTQEYNIALAEENQIKVALANLQKQIDETKEVANKENELLGARKDLLFAIHSKKVNYPMKSVAIFDLSNMANKNEATIYRILDMDRNLTISVRTKTDKKMTELLREISNSKPYAVSTRAIVLDENNKSIAYESNVSVEIR